MLSDRIRKLRKEKGYSQQQMAQKMHLTQGAISQWENGLTVPAADQIIALANVFGISTDELLEHKNDDHEIADQDEVMKIREMLRRDPSYRQLFYALDKAKPEHVKAVADMIKALRSKGDD